MVNVPATGAAILAVALLLTAILGMAVGEWRIAGFSFLSTSLVLYLRETRLVDA